jgi:hypothetical protein
LFFVFFVVVFIVSTSTFRSWLALLNSFTCVFFIQFLCLRFPVFFSVSYWYPL